MHSSRRSFLRTAAAVTLGFRGLQAVFAGRPKSPARDDAVTTHPGFGPLRPDRAGLLDLPAGFTYRSISSAGEVMADGLLVPGKPDGMAAFAGPEGLIILVRNHELEWDRQKIGPFGPANERLGKIPADRIYDAGFRKTPCQGGTTTLVYDTRSQSLRTHFLSLAGTQYNCCGGPTPWGSWITCEENTDRAGDRHEKDHGYPFEVPARTEPGLAEPIPLKAMGRFRREAVAVDARSGIVYQTEDIPDGIITRFIPDQPGNLRAGGRLQALAIRNVPRRDMRNWPEDKGGDGGPRVEPGRPMPVEWITLTDVESPADDLRYRAYDAGAARFARAEGMWYGNDSIYFACTNGGMIQCGQIYRYRPSPFEGTPRESEFPGTLELFIESDDPGLLENADNLTVAPWGDVVLCEDGPNQQHLVGVTPEGRIYKLARNAASTSEFAGACFSPDGTTLFVNIQGDGRTFAITGPWEKRRNA
jgi:secreted PhoX family phosphatase